MDVSHYQGTINWTTVAAGNIDFAFTKATEDINYIDPKFATNMISGKAAGVKMGAYHFARPSLSPTVTADALAEARYFIKNLHPYLDDGILWPVLDLEDGSALGKSAVSSWTRTFCQEVERLTTVKPFIYMGRSYAQSYIETDLTSYPLWIAVPVTTPGQTGFNLGPWADWTVQQYSWVGTVPGIVGDVDLDAFLGDLTDLQSFVLPPLTHVFTNTVATPAAVVRGRTISLTGNITSSRARNLLLGASIFAAGTTTAGTSDAAHDGPVTLSAGAGTATRSFTLPSTLTIGMYDVWLALYLDLNNSGVIDNGDLQVGTTYKKPNALQVYAAENFDTWAADAGLLGTTAAFSADPDNDGQKNLMEYALGSAPSSPNGSTVGIAVVDFPTAGSKAIRVQFSRPVRTDLTYRIQRSANLQTWTTMFSATAGAAFSGGNVSQSTGTVPLVTAYISPLAGTPTFVRVEVVRN
jgi:GH25 family lysozyme M1 (1,4-beta-N-acetylmuramidase)